MNGKPIIDVHTHIWDAVTGGMSPAESKRQLLEGADRFNIEAMVVMPLYGGLYPSADEITRGNDEVAEFAKEDERVWPFVTVHPPLVENTMRELRRRMEEQNFPGAKIWVTIADQPCVYRVIEKMIEYDKPTLIHCLHKAVGQLPCESEPQHIAALARRYPQAKIIMAHFGGDFIYCCDEIADCPNVWTDPSGSYCETGMLEHAAEVLGIDRLLFGSDAPGASFINNIAKVMAADLSDDDKQRVMYTNAKELFG